MTRDEFDVFCAGLPATTHVIQWGSASVWKVGGKIFAICSTWTEGQHDKFSFKCTDLSYQILCELAGIIPAPYLARAKWVQVQKPGTISDGDMKSYIEEAYGIVARKLTKAMQRELGLLDV
ncbi:MmcQ/YjbR family DNA-binding protein [Kordiimonas pumila]|uniref:MmcQ/YjbR family DNA-binding protein n=1 Tax=Kordiimonas pumila TaxID=2161677 RepID=A0ABV7DA43_9PROT|nr:MmcQ/YjbR family DNA-binding protein [Kordiimonas pumila]